MSTTLAPTGSTSGPVTPTAATPAQLAWLEHELGEWQAAGIVDARAAASIRGRYVAVRRLTLARVVLSLGAAFVVAGLIWLVAANLDRFAPLVRFGLVAAIWLGLTVLAEVLAARRERAGDVASPVVGAARLLAAGSFGAVVFQATQSLHVAAYDASLVGIWGLGSLLYAYAVRGVGPLLLAVALCSGWFVAEVVTRAESLFSFAAAVLVAALVATAIGVLHASRWWPEFATPWREIGCAAALFGLFVAAVPFSDGSRPWSPMLLVGVGVAIALALLALLAGDRSRRLELALAAATAVAGIGLASWFVPATGGSDGATGAAYARALVSVLLFLALAAGYAVLGAVTDSPRVTFAATAAFVVFTTFQAFAVFAPILSGAALFLVVGLVLIGVGVGADRGRRRLVASVERESGPPAPGEAVQR